MRTAILASLVMICINFSSFAQSAPLNKQQTVDYIAKLFKANYDGPDVTITMCQLEGKVLVVKNSAGYSFRTDLGKENPDSLALTLDTNNHNQKVYSVIGAKTSILWNIALESDALRLKKALAHLITLVQNEKSTDPFDN